MEPNLPDEIVEKLQTLDYFKYVPKEQLEDVKNKVKKSIGEKKLDAYVDPQLESLYKDLIDLSYDGTRRFYSADAEEIGEGSLQMDLIDKIKALNLFQIESIPEPIAEESEGAADTVVSLIIADETFILWDGSRTADSFERGLEITTQFCKFMNDYCSKNQKLPRFYIQYGGGNDQRVVILTEEIYSYMLTLHLDNNWLPVVVS